MKTANITPLVKVELVLDYNEIVYIKTLLQNPPRGEDPQNESPYYRAHRTKLFNAFSDALKLLEVHV